MNQRLLMLAGLLVGAPVLSAEPPPCQGQSPQRKVWPQGTQLWGTARQVDGNETSSVLVSLELGRARLGGAALEGLRLEGGRLVAPSRAPEGLVGAMLQGTASDGKPVKVALCGAEPAPEDPSMLWYRIELWNAVRASWENPCVATHQVPSPRALAVGGGWDERGARRDVPGKFTFACENGAIAKCIDWGYKPWAKKDGRPLAELHQACTRMARADYCGDGRSHTREAGLIDIYDGLGLLTRTAEAVAGWSPERASFEAAWTPEGASCLAHRRDGRPVETVLAECPGRFEAVAEELGDGERCRVRRKGRSSGAALLRNLSYGQGASRSPPGE